MEAQKDFKVTLAERSKLKDISLENIPFGKYFTDHMLVADYENGKWQTPEIVPYQSLMLDPSLAVLHYGQAIFEGIKAYRLKDGSVKIFRPNDNFKRFNASAVRMQMPEVPEAIFMEGLRKLIAIDKDWVPSNENHSLYIRPFMISSDAAIGVRPSEKYKFLIILSPTGPYYATPMRIYAEEKYVRAVPGGIGFAKAAGNYGAVLYPSAEAHKKGYDQVLWMDAFEHKYVQECGTMNAFFIIGDKVITPGLEEGTILAGVTRDSVITVLKEMGFEVEERPLSIDEIIEAHKAGQLKEIFGTGTAATIALIKELKYKDYEMAFDVTQWKTAPEVRNRIDAIRYGYQPDTHGWLWPV
ncbi:MAG: branched-chain amino acid aminotransferase [Chitinophagaceae bacterium]|nr:branched-chain amino acid aminotransferase [Chitinophagaceae bacterium]